MNTVEDEVSYQGYKKIEALNLSWESLENLQKDDLIKGYPAVNENSTIFHLKDSIPAIPSYYLKCDRLRFEEKIMGGTSVPRISDFIVKCSEDVELAHSHYDNSHSTFSVKKDANFILPLTGHQRYTPDKDCVVTHERWNDSIKRDFNNFLITDHKGKIFCLRSDGTLQFVL